MRPPSWPPRSFISASTRCGRPRATWRPPACRCGSTLEGPAGARSDSHAALAPVRAFSGKSLPSPTGPAEGRPDDKLRRGWNPVFRPKMRQCKNAGAVSVSSLCETAADEPTLGSSADAKFSPLPGGDDMTAPMAKFTIHDLEQRVHALAQAKT